MSALCCREWDSSCGGTPWQIADRRLDPAWVERVAFQPDWSEPDPQPGVTRHYGTVPEFGGRVLRVVVADRGDERHILTVHFDRGARRRRP